MKNLAFMCLFLTLVSCTDDRWSNYDSSGILLSNGMLLSNTQTSKLIIDPEFGIAFDCVILGCRQSRSIRITNGSGNPITIYKMELAKDSSSDFSLVENPAMMMRSKPISLAPREHLIVDVLYQPSDGSADGASLLIDWQGQQKLIPIRTRILGEKVAKTSDLSLNFGYVAVGQQKTLYFPIENTSTGNAVISITTDRDLKNSDVFTPEFEKKLYLNPGQKTKIPILFSPKEEGVFEHEIAFLIEGSTAPRIIARCMGTSVAKTKITFVDPKEGLVDFGTHPYGAIHKRTVTVRNEGHAPTALDVQLFSEPKNAFLLEELSSQNEMLLAPMETVTLSLIASPKIGGKNHGQLKIKPIVDDAASIFLPMSIFYFNRCTLRMRQFATVSYPKITLKRTTMSCSIGFVLIAHSGSVSRI